MHATAAWSGAACAWGGHGVDVYHCHQIHLELQLAPALLIAVRLQVKKRLVVAPSSFVIQVVDENGLRLVKTIRGDLPASS